MCQQSMLARATTVAHDSLPKSSSARMDTAAQEEAGMAAHRPVHTLPAHATHGTGVIFCVSSAMCIPCVSSLHLACTLSLHKSSGGQRGWHELQERA